MGDFALPANYKFYIELLLTVMSILRRHCFKFIPSPMAFRKKYKTCNSLPLTDYLTKKNFDVLE